MHTPWMNYFYSIILMQIMDYINCCVYFIGNDELQLWLIPLVRFLELIFMTLELCGESDVKMQLEKQRLLIKIMSQLNHLPVDVVENLSEVRTV